MVEEVNISETTENYLKQIYLLVKVHDSARISDLAKNLDRSLSTVTGAVQRMVSENLLHHERYGRITLTDEGYSIAKGIVVNYDVMTKLLMALGVKESQANIDACEMEHISEESIQKIKEFLEFVEGDEEASKIIDKFQD